MLKIYHNPRCSKSRQTLALLEERGLSPEVVLYLKTPLSAADVLDLAKKTGEPLSALIRTNEAPIKEQVIDVKALSEQQLADLVAQHPILLNRPIVETESAARVGRPIERVEAIL